MKLKGSRSNSILHRNNFETVQTHARWYMHPLSREIRVTLFSTWHSLLTFKKFLACESSIILSDSRVWPNNDHSLSSPVEFPTGWNFQRTRYAAVK